MRLTRHIALSAGLGLATSLALALPVLAADPLDAAIKRGSGRVASSYLETGMSGMNSLIDTCLVEARRRPSTAKYAECVAIAGAAHKLDVDGARRFGTPLLLKERVIYAKTGPAFLRHGGDEGELNRIHALANPGL